MSTTLTEIESKGMILEIYDSSAGCTLWIHPKNSEQGMKFMLYDEAADQIKEAMEISRNLPTFGFQEDE